MTDTPDVATTQWFEGPLEGLVWPGGAALLDLAPEPAAQVWARVRPTPGLAAFLAALAQVAGADWQQLPAFAVALRAGDGWQVAARGKLGVQVATAAGARTVSGEHHTTWAEEHLEQVGAITLGTPQGLGSLDAGRPIESGVVPAAGLVVAVQAGDAGQASTPPPDAGRASTPPPDAGRASAASRDPEPAPVATPQPPSGKFKDLLSQHTVLRPIEDAAVRQHDDEAGTPAPASGRPEPKPTEPVDSFTDHDGHTVMAGDFGPPQHPGQPAQHPGPEPASGNPVPQVLAIFCPHGHANPPQRTQCRVCTARLAGTPRTIPAPALGWLHTPTGERIEFAGPIIAGRKPTADRIQGPVLPRLVTLPHQRISGNHVKFFVEGWAVYVQDLHSRNGTFLIRGGQTQRLTNHPLSLISGDRIDLGYGVMFTVSEVP